ncbi:single-stranded DNA-binding protein [Thermodesulfovibrio yellowstonii]|uniref:single-stranded DNA-binding protein n=1 Tax=Thermodesulfovibrio yellowstonii TaxID=28262 RepID=UPI000423F4EB|nr:single-stranded DNA-binding protein [Thermodesulfovibrio islandicus]
MFNRIILIGNLTRDPELRYTPTGVAVVTVPIAVNTRYKQGEETKEETLFIEAVVFGKQADSCMQYLSKGQPVLVEGRLRERRWEHEGQKRSKFEVIAQSVRFLPKKEKPQETESEVVEVEEIEEPF